MQTIWKFKLEIKKYQVIKMPANAEILTAQFQFGAPVLWAKVDADAHMRNRIFVLLATGEEIEDDNINYITTIQFKGGGYILHLFEITESNQTTGKEKKQKLYQPQKEIHDELFKIVYKNAGSPELKSWVIFENGTFVLLEPKTKQVKDSGIEIIREFDCEDETKCTIEEIGDGEGFLVKNKTKELQVFVHPKELNYRDLTDENIRDYAWLKQSVDAKELNIIDFGEADK